MSHISCELCIMVQSLGKGKEEFWLVWRYEGDATLDTLMSDKNFPYNV